MLRNTVPMTYIMDYLIHIYCKVKSPLIDTKIQDAKSLGLEILSVIFPNPPVPIDPEFKAMKLAFMLILFNDVFLPIFKRLEPEMIVLHRPTLESVFAMCDSIDRYQELKSIFQRAIAKRDEQVPPLKKSKFSLKYFSLALKAVSFKKTLDLAFRKLNRPVNIVR